MPLLLPEPLIASSASDLVGTTRTTITRLDWIVIVLYALGMLAVGWYYGQRSKSTDDYMLGGRNMSPLAVGLSLFASLLSTLTYLAIPGEMIKYGPMMLAQLIAIPAIAAVVGWVLIPILMKQPVTSAYEILEMRLGLGVRLLGSGLFLLVRLFWMSLVIFATADKVLVPILGLSESAVPWMCTILGLITIIYTSWGGLRAVVLTDVIQTAILFFAAGLALYLVSKDVGGVTEWWPSSWPEHWQEPVVAYSPDVRFTFVGAFLAFFTWFVCTAGSDQVAIQRYMATRDAKTARRMFNSSLLANVLLWPFLACVGVALMTYFRVNPQMLPVGETVTSAADELLPIFIVKGLPAGISGLVIAGLMAAAMSSLSSGLNSGCSVIVSDFIDRFRDHGSAARKSDVHLSRIVSFSIGVVVVALGVLVGQVEGNLLQLCYKIANLLTAPLFLLFFMALFVPWATSFGTYVGTAVAVAVAVAIGYFEVFGIGFVWLLPASFLCGVTVGCLFSIPKIGQRVIRPDK